jgi:hypothetical protein
LAEPRAHLRPGAGWVLLQGHAESSLGNEAAMQRSSLCLPLARLAFVRGSRGSELLAQIFGDRGAHARSAFGVAQIPMGACVEIELIAEVD